MAIAVRVEYIKPDEATMYLVGTEGLVWVEPSLGGESYIVAARNAIERDAAARFIGELLKQGLVPYGMPLNQRATVAMFGGSPIRDCSWVLHWKAPGGDDADLPTRAAVIVESA